MPNYYLHHTHGQPPLSVLTDLVLDLRPGAIIQVSTDFFEVLGGRPIIQNTSSHAVHVHVEYVKEISGHNARKFNEALALGLFYDNED